MSDPVPIAPCPFCNGNAHIRLRSHSMPRPQTYQVQCGECYCGTSDRYEVAAYAIATWNRRFAQGIAVRMDEDPKGLHAKRKSPVAEGDAPILSPSSDSGA